MMSSRLLLLVLAALAACLRSGRAQVWIQYFFMSEFSYGRLPCGRPLMFQVCAYSNPEEDDEKPENEMHSNGTHKRLPRSLNVQVAQQAMCKMTKIQFINRQPVYEKVIIPVEDHKLENITTTTINQKQVTKISMKRNSSRRKRNVFFVTNTTDTISLTNIQRKQLANNRLAHKEQGNVLKKTKTLNCCQSPRSNHKAGSQGGDTHTGYSRDTLEIFL
ncbi:adenylate terminal-differentiation specific-like protein [Labeo rohita]|uniref:Adenylate terminal-differentiation specific-like protein n=1 Tax=Labeo rohita TaxID=84645 RepID=A0A498LLI8_LABRO|nr:adenylate terminal-differentiation specific-like protein [Labeo rohita]